jgi:hypothetical protein
MSQEIAMPTGDEAAAFWKLADEALVAGDVPTLERLLRERSKMLRKRRPSSSRLFPVDYSGTDVRTIILRNHQFENWDQFTAYASTLKDGASPVARFEQAADAIITGDAATLRGLLTRNPGLVRARSTRPLHSTLLHYIGANGVEGFRQRTPQNAVEIADVLLDAGADIDAVTDMYGGGATTLGLVATSIHPKVAGVLHASPRPLARHPVRSRRGG